jgi:metal transporter CNNM
MLNYLIVIILLIFSALFSGLTLGLMSLSAPELKRKVALGDKDAKKVYPVRKQGNLLLTTLLIGNVAINAALSIFLGSIASGLTAGLTATALIVVFGEITPQAVFSRFALSLGAKTAWLVRIFIIILYPISWPIAWVLNKTLGEEMVTIYSKQELMKIVEEHKAT